MKFPMLWSEPKVAKPRGAYSSGVLTLLNRRLFIILGLFLSITACFPSPTSSFQDSRPEALRWLEENTNPSALAGNWFDTTEDAITFVQQLYELGAEVIYIEGIRDEYWRTDHSSSYADALIVILPDEPQKRAVLFELFREEYQNQGFEPVYDQDQNQVLLWWD